MNCQTKQRSGALHITQSVDYAIILLSTLVKEKNSLSIKKIAEINALSFSFLQKVAGLLRQAKLIKAERGKYGGYTINKDPNKLTIKEIIEAIEGPIAIVPCLKEARICTHSFNCKAKFGFAKINDEIQNLILSKSLNHFII